MSSSFSYQPQNPQPYHSSLPAWHAQTHIPLQELREDDFYRKGRTLHRFAPLEPPPPPPVTRLPSPQDDRRIRYCGNTIVLDAEPNDQRECFSIRNPPTSNWVQDDKLTAAIGSPSNYTLCSDEDTVTDGFQIEYHDHGDRPKRLSRDSQCRGSWVSYGYGYSSQNSSAAYEAQSDWLTSSESESFPSTPPANGIRQRYSPFDSPCSHCSMNSSTPITSRGSGSVRSLECSERPSTRRIADPTTFVTTTSPLSLEYSWMDFGDEDDEEPNQSRHHGKQRRRTTSLTGFLSKGESGKRRRRLGRSLSSAVTLPFKYLACGR